MGVAEAEREAVDVSVPPPPSPSPPPLLLLGLGEAEPGVGGAESLVVGVRDPPPLVLPVACGDTLALGEAEAACVVEEEAEGLAVSVARWGEGVEVAQAAVP